MSQAIDVREIDGICVVTSIPPIVPIEFLPSIHETCGLRPISLIRVLHKEFLGNGGLNTFFIFAEMSATTWVLVEGHGVLWIEGGVFGIKACVFGIARILGMCWCVEMRFFGIEKGVFRFMETRIRHLGGLWLVIWVVIFEGMRVFRWKHWRDWWWDFYMKFLKKYRVGIYKGGIRTKERYFGEIKLNLLIFGTLFCLLACFLFDFVIFNYTRGLFNHVFNLLKTLPFFQIKFGYQFFAIFSLK